MRIVFICGSLEPGKDGVGDYASNLAAELANQGHTVGLIALNDQHTHITTQSGEHGLQLLRIPSALMTNDKVSLALKHIKFVQPDWVSLQFVPYAYHYKGLPFSLPSILKKLQGSYKWHIMVHETWLGISALSSSKDKLIGALQRGIFKRMIKAVRPSQIATSNFLYSLVMSKKGIQAQVLPLFSNIPVYPIDTTFKTTVLNQLGIDEKRREECKVLTVFGNIYPNSKLEAVLHHELQENQGRLALVGMGKMSEWASEEFKRLEVLYQDRIVFRHLGILSEQHISTVLQLADAGISCTPLEHLGKSGVYAAMRLHGLEVIIPEQPTIPEFDPVQYAAFANRSAGAWSVSSVASQFAAQLSHA